MERGAPSYLNWFTKNDKTGDELLNHLKDKGLIEGWGEDKGIKYYIGKAYLRLQTACSFLFHEIKINLCYIFSLKVRNIKL